MPRTFLGTTYRKTPRTSRTSSLLWVLFPLFLCTNLNFGSSSLRHRCSPGASGGPDIRGHLEATVNVRQCLWSTRFVCRHYEGEYQKHPSDNSRASRQILRCSCPASSLMKAISVTILATSSSFCSHSSRFQSDPVRKNMPASARDDALSLIESLHIQWGKCSQGKLKRLSCAYTMQIANGGYARRKTATFVVRI